MEQTTLAQAKSADLAQDPLEVAAVTRPISGPEPVRLSLLRYAPAFVLLAIALADCVQYADPDLWGHVRFGQIVLQTGHLIRHDIFSYSAPGALWLNHEWLSEVIMGWCFNALGVLGLKLLKFACAGAIVLLLNAGLAETEAAPDTQFALLLAASFAIAGQVEYRPQLADYIFLAAILVMLARDLRGRRARLWLIVPIMVLWANLHGGFIVGLAALGLYAGVTGVQELWNGEWPRRGIRFAALMAAALAVTLINPYGVGEWYVVLHNFQNPLTMHLNVEFQSLVWQLRQGGLTATSLAPYVFPVGLMALLAVSFALTPSRNDLALVAIAALMSAAAIYAIRNMALAAIACAAPAAHHLQLALDRYRRPKTRKGSAPRIHAAPTIQLAAFAGAIFLAFNQGVFSERLPSYVKCPAGAVEFMQSHDLHGNVLCQYVWGVYLIWHEAPRSKVFFDSFELRYPQSVQNDYLSFAFRGGAAAEAMLGRYPHDYILVQTVDPPYRFMMRQSGWKLIYRDPVAALFARADSPAARIAGVPIIREKAPSTFFP